MCRRSAYIEGFRERGGEALHRGLRPAVPTQIREIRSPDTTVPPGAHRSSGAASLDHRCRDGKRRNGMEETGARDLAPDERMCGGHRDIRPAIRRASFRTCYTKDKRYIHAGIRRVIE